MTLVQWHCCRRAVTCYDTVIITTTTTFTTHQQHQDATCQLWVILYMTVHPLHRWNAF
jgi:hypothetical protein